jgi:polyhydroxybutyrate depolymerase
MTLACTRADLFAAAASVIMNLTDESARACQPSRPVPMLMMNGTADPLIPYQGGRGARNRTSFRSTSTIATNPTRAR